MLNPIHLVFIFVLGACIGSFLNVVVWRLPRGESLNSPPSHCPKCNRLLLWRDNLPIVGWIKLGGRCRFCKAPISARYPIVEAATALLFAFYYLAFYAWGLGPGSPRQVAAMIERAAAAGLVVAPSPAPLGWPIFFLYLFMAGSLLAASLIDAELFEIPLGIPWLLAGVALVVHALADHPSAGGALCLGVGPGHESLASSAAAGGAVGLLASIAMRRAGLLPASFPLGEPILEAHREELAEQAEKARRAGEEVPELPPEYTPRQIRAEMRKEMLFLLPPLALALLWTLLTTRVAPLASAWRAALAHDWVAGLLGSLLGALVGGLVVWSVRILGTLGFGRLAMGLGDADLMLGVGATIGAGGATVAFFLAPFFGVAVAIYMLLTGKKRELPYGPYLSLASAFVMLFYLPIVAYLAPGLAVLLNESPGLGR